ncbi:MAG: hypothetical protein WCX64_01220 [Candidatus Micrarchaeia archaeon]
MEERVQGKRRPIPAYFSDVSEALHAAGASALGSRQNEALNESRVKASHHFKDIIGVMDKRPLSFSEQADIRNFVGATVGHLSLMPAGSEAGRRVSGQNKPIVDFHSAVMKNLDKGVPWSESRERLDGLYDKAADRFSNLMGERKPLGYLDAVAFRQHAEAIIGLNLLMHGRHLQPGKTAPL